jgi:hypothetical protein
VTESFDISIFISYGRRDASAFVHKVAKDLQNAGFTVWRDTNDLRSLQAWDEQLATSLKRCDSVIAILTPHAVRTGREAGSELAFARFSPPPTPIIGVANTFAATRAPPGSSVLPT